MKDFYYDCIEVASNSGVNLILLPSSFAVGWHGSMWIAEEFLLGYETTPIDHVVIFMAFALAFYLIAVMLAAMAVGMFTPPPEDDKRWDNVYYTGRDGKVRTFKRRGRGVRSQWLDRKGDGD